MHPDDTNIFASNIIDKYENWPDNLHSMCLADFASSYVSKKVDDLSIEPDEIKSYTVPVSNINDVKVNPNMWPVAGKRTIQFCVSNRVWMFPTLTAFQKFDTKISY